MRLRTFAGILFALALIVGASYLAQQNIELLARPFQLTAGSAVSLYTVLIVVFLLGFLPVVSVLLVQTLKRDLALRRERRTRREARSRRGSFRRAVDLQADRQWGKAAAELEMLLADRPEDYSAMLRYGEVLRHLGRADEALEVHRKASVLYPHSVALLYQLAEDYEATGDPEVAHQIRDRVVRDFSGLGLEVLRRRRSRALSERDWRSAARLQEKIDLLLEDNRDPRALEGEEGVRRGLAYQQAVEHLEHDRPEEARDLLRQVLERDPRFLPALIMLGEAALLEDDETGALDCWQRGWEATGSATFLQRIEDHFIEREKPMEAIETLHRLIASSASDLIPRFFLGRLYHRLEMHEEALRALAPLRERIRSPRFHLLLARIHERRGEMAKAVESYLACVEQIGLPLAEYACRVCGARSPAWRSQCDSCRSWGSVELELTAGGEASRRPGRPVRAVLREDPPLEGGGS